MRRINLLAILSLVGVSAAFGQQISTGPGWTDPRFDLSAGYTFINANAPPGQSIYFGLKGAYGSGDFHVNDWLNVEGRFTWGHANDISQLGQNLTLITYSAGPKVTLFRKGHLEPFAEALF